MNKNSRSIFFLLRHSERAEQVKELGIEIEEPNDPPLTTHGIEWSDATGKWLQTYLSQNGYKKIIIRSSPFLRTLQTASSIAKALNIDSIEVEYSVHECLYKKLFPCNPDSSLMIRTKSVKEVSEKYLNGVKFVDHTDCDDYEKFRSIFPEKGTDVFHRSKLMTGKFIEEVKSFDEPTAVICISHMALMKRFNFQTSFSFVKSFSWLALVVLYFVFQASL